MKAKYFYLMISIFLFMYTLLYFPYVECEYINSGIVYSLIIGLLDICLISYFIIKAYEAFPEKNLTYIAPLIFGKFLGKVFCIIFIVTNTFIGFFFFVGIIMLLKNFTMPSTPNWYIGLFVDFLIVSSLNAEEKSVVKILSTYAVILLVSLPFLIVIGFQDSRMIYVKGTILHSLTKTPQLASVVAFVFYFSGIENLAVYNKCLTNKSVLGIICIYIFLGIPLVLLIIFFPVSIWGFAARNIEFVQITSSDSIAIDLFFIERAIFVFLPIFIISGLAAVINYVFTSYKLLEVVIENKKVSVSFISSTLLIFTYLSNKLTSISNTIHMVYLFGVYWFVFINASSILIYIFTRRWLKNTNAKC